MRLLRARNGQSMAEYAILFAIVIGAAIAMQQYIKSRLQGATQGAADNYLNTVSATAGFAAVPFEPNRVTHTESNTNENLAMQSATVGQRVLGSASESVSDIVK